MSLDISWGELASTVWETAIGERVVGPVDEDVTNDSTNPIWKWADEFLPDWLQDGLKAVGSRLKDWGVGIIRSIKSWGLSTITGFFMANKNFMWNFNWNASDTALDAQIAAKRTAIAGRFGSFLGCGFGWAAGMAFGVGLDLSMDAIGKSLGIPLLAFDKGASLRAVRTATEEGLDELSGLLGGLARDIVLVTLQSFFVGFYKNVRKLIKFGANILPPEMNENVQRWGAENSQPWSFAIFTEESVDAIPWAPLRLFAENFLEEADECFIEAAYVYAASVDRYKQELLDTREAVMGVQNTVEITPDRDAPNEVITISGRDQVARGAIVSALATHQLLYNRDVGQWVGQPANEQLRQQSPISTLSLRIIYYPVDSPPFTRENFAANGGDADAWHTCDIAIPYIDPARLDWERIRRAAGLQGRLFGRYRAYGYLGGRKVEVYGGSELEAKTWITELAELSEAPLVGLGYTRRDRNAASVSSLSQQFESCRVFPAYAIVTSQRREIDKALGRPTLQGNFTSREERIDLWTDEAPPFASALLTEWKKYHTPLAQLGVGFTAP